MVDLSKFEDIPDEVWVARFGRSAFFNTDDNKITLDVFTLREEEDYFSVNILVFNNRKKRSKEWLIRRLIQTQSMEYKDDDFFIVMTAKELRAVFKAVLKYVPGKDVFNHAALVSPEMSFAFTKKLGKLAYEHINDKLKDYIYFVGDFRCTHEEGCKFSEKNLKFIDKRIQ